MGVKRGQIAHLDRDRTNNTIANLAYLCLEHHDAYDSTSRQSKGFSAREVRAYRAELRRTVVPVIEPRARRQRESALDARPEGQTEFGTPLAAERLAAIQERLAK